MTSIIENYQPIVELEESTYEDNTHIYKCNVFKYDNKALNNSNNKEMSKEMKQFFDNVEIVNKNINNIKNAIIQLYEINDKIILSVTKDQEDQYFKEEMEPLIKSTNKIALLTKEIINKLIDDKEQFDNKSYKIKQNVVNTITNKYVLVMKDYQFSQNKYKNDIKKKIKSQILAIKPNASTNEIETIIHSSKGTKDLMKGSILTGDASSTITNSYYQVNSKYEEVIALEDSINEIKDIFYDFLLIIDKQGDMLDHIEFQVNQGVEYLNEANQVLEENIQLQKNIWKGWCCCCLNCWE